MRALISIAACALACAPACGREGGTSNNDNAPTQANANDVPEKATPPSSKRPQYPAPEPVGTIPGDAQRTPSGAAYKLLGKEGTSNERPGPNDSVLVEYTQWDAKGTTMMSTRWRGKPQAMSLTVVGPGWSEALSMMTVGESRQLWMTPTQAFGDRARNAPSQIMTYEVKLVSIMRAPETPKDVAGPPPDATKTKSGLAYKVIEKGGGNVHPRWFDEVEIDFTSWTTEGRMIDSTILRKKPRKALLLREMEGWREGIPTMVEGETKRFWIPEELTKTLRWKRRGMLVFDITLESIKRNKQPPDPPKTPAAAPAGATRLDNGIAYVVVKKGSGKRAGKADKVKVHYSVWDAEGKLFESSIMRDKPTTTQIGKALPGWNAVLPLMRVGDKLHVWVPQKLAYRGRPGPQGNVVFELELLEATAPPKPPPPPADVAGPPADATKTASGLAYKVLRKGDGKQHPTLRSSVQANYTGWTTDGKLFDSTIPLGKPRVLAVQRVIPGMREALQLMVTGDHYLLWIPQDIAYKGKPGKPAGTLVFDIEVVGIR